MLLYAMADYETTTKLDSRQILDQALEVDGSLAPYYDYFHSYSLANQVALYIQGVRDIVGKRSDWAKVGRTPLKGEERYWIWRPVMVMRPKEDGEAGEGEMEEVFTGRFQKTWCLYTLPQTEGEPVKPPGAPGWSLQQALGRLGVQLGTFHGMNGNVQGYSHGNTIAISPIAANPLKTGMHELAHVKLGHTAPGNLPDYLTHRGIKEFQAEGVAYVVLNMLGALDEQTARESRGYIRWWLKNEQPPEQACREVISTADRILRAGRVLGRAAVSNTVELDTGGEE